ncbi:MAG: pyruvate kinase [bacterium]|nr:pyruvate kinase [bacterium]
MTNSKAQIVATIGPSSAKHEILLSMIRSGLSIVRLNFSWADLEEHTKQIDLIHRVGKEEGKNIPIIIDLPGPRIQQVGGHTYDKNIPYSLADNDKGYIKYGIEKKVEYFALSFVSCSEDVLMCKKFINDCGGKQMVIAKIERQKAMEGLGGIIEVSDAIMIARGDLGKEVPIEKIPFIQGDIIRKCKIAGKPVITATEMLFSMVSNPIPTMAEVTDVANAIIQGSDAVMLSNETTIGKYPVEAVAIMGKIVVEAEKHLPESAVFHPLLELKN